MTTPRKGAGLHGSEGKLASAVVAGTVFRAARGLRAAASQRRVRFYRASGVSRMGGQLFCILQLTPWPELENNTVLGKPSPASHARLFWLLPRSLRDTNVTHPCRNRAQVGNTSARRSASNMGQSRAASPLLDSGGGLAIGGHRG